MAIDCVQFMFIVAVAMGVFAGLPLGMILQRHTTKQCERFLSWLAKRWGVDTGEVGL